MNKRAAYAAGIAWSTIFGLSFLVTKSALEAFSPLTLLALRFGLATAALGILAAAGAVRLRFRGKPRGILALVCLFQPVLYFASETFGVQRTSTGTAGLILGALPAAVAALSVPMLRERLSAGRTAGLALTVAGVSLVGAAGSAGGTDDPLGVLLILGALAGAAFYNVFSRRASRFYGPAEITFAMMASGAIFFGLAALAEGSAAGSANPGLRPGIAAWGAVAYLGILSSVVAFFLVNLSLSRLRAAQASVFGALTPLIALSAGALVRGEPVSIAKAAGAAAILAGLWITNAPGRKAGEPSGEKGSA
jgi:drug/metabolite transporter (DMT)-like permease